jgi:hypothetical protein
MDRATVSTAAFVSLRNKRSASCSFFTASASFASRFAEASAFFVSSSCVCFSTTDASLKSSHASIRLFPAFLFVTNLRCAAARVAARFT